MKEQHQTDSCYTRVPGGCGFFVQLIIKFCRIYADMNESSGTPTYKYGVIPSHLYYIDMW